MSRGDSAGCLIGIVPILIWGAAIVGWVLNVVRVIQTVDLPITGMFILRCVGIIVAPLGSILGLFFR